MNDAPVSDITIGEHAVIGPHVAIISNSITETWQGGPRWGACGRNVTIGDNVFVGAGSIIMYVNMTSIY